MNLNLLKIRPDFSISNIPAKTNSLVKTQQILRGDNISLTFSPSRLFLQNFTEFFAYCLEFSIDRPQEILSPLKRRVLYTIL